MGEVVSFSKKKEGLPPSASPLFSAHFGKDDGNQWIVSIDFVDPAIEAGEPRWLRFVADAMEDMARMIRDHAEAKEPSDDGVVMAFVRVMESSRVRVWTSNKVETAAQTAWLHARFDDAKLIVTADDEP